jgi:hypothetical protein
LILILCAIYRYVIFIESLKVIEIILRPDSKGKLNIGELAQGVSSYRVVIGEHGVLTLYPYAEIPFSEKWIFENKELLEKFKEEHKAKE